MAITDQRVVKFCNEVVRPLAERGTDFIEDARAALARWDEDIDALVPQQRAEKLDDGRRDREGVTELDGVDITSFMALLKKFVDLHDGLVVTQVADASSVIRKPRVRTLRRG